MTLFYDSVKNEKIFEKRNSQKYQQYEVMIFKVLLLNYRSLIQNDIRPLNVC